jgi:IS5 family transposase
MYKTRDRQINFDDFNQPLGFELDLENRWVKKARLIPWDEIEKRYSGLFPSKEGNVAKPARLALGSILIQQEYNFSDEETAAMIRENPYFQYFCGMSGYDGKAPFDPSMMTRFRKRFTPEILGVINEMIVKSALEAREAKKKKMRRRRPVQTGAPDTKGAADGEQPVEPELGGGQSASTVSAKGTSDTPPPNNGTLIVDATCAPSYIKYPQDTDLLNQARLKTEKIISGLHDSVGGKRPRTYPRKAKAEYGKFSRKRKKARNEIRNMVGKELNYLRRNLAIISSLLVLAGGVLSKKCEDSLEVIKKLYAQQLEMHENKTHSIPDRIVSLSQPWLRPIVRGKANSPVEFGAKLDVSVVEGFTRLEHISFSAYNESGLFIEEVERYRRREGFYPERVLADKIYRTHENLRFCREHGARLSGPPLGRPPKSYKADRKREYHDSCERIEVERRFSLAKRKYGMGMLYTRLEATTMSSVALSILLMNLNKVLFCRKLLAYFLLSKFITTRKIRAVQWTLYNLSDCAQRFIDSCGAKL